VLTRRCVVTSVNVDRLAGIARAAAEQCERLSVPEVRPARPLHAVLDGWDGAPLLVAPNGARRQPIHALAPGAAALLTGPEGRLRPGRT
jgi:16S rRNA (uracil1498-N3)-methyltransferase